MLDIIPSLGQTKFGNNRPQTMTVVKYLKNFELDVFEKRALWNKSTLRWNHILLFVAFWQPRSRMYVA